MSSINRRLVSTLIKGHFGDSIQLITDCLFLKGDYSISSLNQFTGMNVKIIKEGLFVLLQHNLIKYLDPAQQLEHWGGKRG